MKSKAGSLASNASLLMFILIMLILTVSCGTAGDKGSSNAAKDKATADTGSISGNTLVSTQGSITGSTLASSTDSADRAFTLTASFQDGAYMPVKYAYKAVPGGKNISPGLAWTDPPEGTKSLVLLMYDLNPVAHNWVHWAIINIPAAAGEIPEGASNTADMPQGSVELTNSYGEKSYGGPNPPHGSGRHEYRFILYALNTEKVDMNGFYSAADFNSAMEGKALGTAVMTGYFEQ